MFVNWGSEPFVTEHTPSGRVVFGLRLGTNTYRAIRAPWTVRPTDPQVAEANQLRADIQQQLRALTPVPSGDGSDQAKGEPRSR